MPWADAENVFKEPLSNQRRARAEDDDGDDRPRKKRARDDDDEDEVETEDEDRPRKKRSRDDDDEDATRKAGAGSKPMPIALVGAILVAFGWGFLSLHDSCLRSTGSVVSVIQHYQMVRGIEDEVRRMQALGVNMQQRVEHRSGELYTITGTSVFRLLGAVLLVAGATLLLKRKTLGKYLAIAGPGLMILVELIGMVICLILSKGVILTPYNVDFLVNIVFSVLAAGSIAFLLLGNDVSKVLR